MTSPALFVLRLVLRRADHPPPSLSHQARAFATAHPLQIPSHTSAPSTSSSSSTSTPRPARPFHFPFISEPPDEPPPPPQTDFLEDDAASPDYALAASRLPPPPRPRLAAEFFQARPCDPLYALVSAGNLSAARQARDELMSHGVKITWRRGYLQAASQSLDEDPGPSGRAEFLAWLRLYPRRSSTESSQRRKEVWWPVVRRLLRDFPGEVEFLESFVKVATDRGLATTVLPPMRGLLVRSLPPDQSRRLWAELLDSFWTVTVRAGHADGGKRDRRLRKRVEGFWKQYLRELVVCGYTHAAKELLDRPPDRVHNWGTTYAALVQEALEPESLDHLPEEIVDNPAVALPDRIHRAILAPPPIWQLAELVSELQACGDSALLDDFRAEFIRPSAGTSMAYFDSPTVRRGAWWTAEILRLEHASQHAAALEIFRTHFVWMGVPPLPAHLLSPPTTAPDNHDNDVPLLPTIQTVNALLPSLLQLAGSASAIHEYHRAYLSLVPSLPPSLRPTPRTHRAFVRALAVYKSPMAAQNAIERITAEGLEPGSKAYGVVLQGWAECGKWDRVEKILEGGMKVEAGVYDKLREVAVARGEGAWAERMQSRKEAWVRNEAAGAGDGEGDELGMDERVIRRHATG